MRPHRRLKRFNSSLWLIGTTLFPTALLFSQNIPIAILDFEASGISQTEAITLTDRLRNELFRLGKFDVVERGLMEGILHEQDFQMLGCTSNDCLVEVGRLVGARQVVGGRISKIGGMFTVSARVVDVETGKVLGVSDYDLRGGLDEMLIVGMKQVAQNIINPPTQQHPRAGRAKTMLSIGGKSNTLSGDFALNIDFGYATDSTKYFQYGMILGFAIPSYSVRHWPSDNTFIDGHTDESTTFITDDDNIATLNDLDRLGVYGYLLYGMLIITKSYGWHEGFYGSKLYAGAGYSKGIADITYHGKIEIENPDYYYGYYNDYFDYRERYEIEGLVYTAGVLLRLGWPRFSLVFSARVFSEPVTGTSPYLSAGILWPF